MRKIMFVSFLVLAVGFTTDAGIVGKSGATLPDRADTNTNQRSPVQAAWEWSSGGSIDVVPTTGGTWDGWGEYFVVQVSNTTGSDQQVIEVGFPCAGTIGSEWMIWLDSTMPASFVGGDFSGTFTATDTDDTVFPPVNYTYVDVSGDGVVIPAGQTFWFGYKNPGNSGQVDYNNIDSYGWYNGAWDADGPWGRTTVMQFKANPVAQPTPTPSGPQPVPTASRSGLVLMMFLLGGVAVVVLRRRMA